MQPLRLAKIDVSSTLSPGIGCFNPAVSTCRQGYYTMPRDVAHGECFTNLHVALTMYQLASPYGPLHAHCSLEREIPV
jgi:hypothetical protein